MNAIDTNILIRYLTQDDVNQGEVAKELTENGEPVFLAHIVFIESVWVLATWIDILLPKYSTRFQIVAFLYLKKLKSSARHCKIIRMVLILPIC